MKKNNKNKRLNTNGRIKILIYCLAFFVLVYLIRLIRLQIFDVYGYSKKGDKISKIESITSPPRGNIFDSEGRPLAINQNIDNVYLMKVTTEAKRNQALEIINDGKRFSKLSQEEKDAYLEISDLPVYTEEEISKLANILQIDEKEIYKFINKGEEGYIYKAATNSIKENIKVLDLDYISFKSEYVRYYPNHEIFAKVLGFVDSNDGANYGLEAYYNDILSGQKGYKEFYKALRGTGIPFETGQSIESKEALNLVTSLNEDYQKLVYNALKRSFLNEKPQKITALLMDPNSGEVLAQESIPTFDANDPRALNSEIDKIFINSLDSKNVQNYMIGRWMNEAASMTYEPGSVFKSITAAIGLESTDTVEKKTYICKGYQEIAPGVIINCFRYWDPHGVQSLKEAFYNSCNPSFVQMIWEIGREKFVEYGSALRFGMKTGIDLPMEYTGSFPKDTNISDVDFAPMSYGHSLSVTPIQILSALNATVNGGTYYQPHLVKKITNREGNSIFEYRLDSSNRVLSEQSSKTMREMYENNASTNPVLIKTGLKLGIKTGTTKKVVSSNPLKPDDGFYEKNFASIFMAYPADAPKYTLLVILDEPLYNPMGVQSALNAAAEIMSGVAKIDNKGVGNKVETNERTSLPDLKGLTLKEAENVLAISGFSYKAAANMKANHVVAKQYPEAGSIVEKNVQIELSQDSKSHKIKMPEVIGMETKDAQALLNTLGIKHQLLGQGSVIIDQAIKANQIFEESQTVDLTLGEEANE